MTFFVYTYTYFWIYCNTSIKLVCTFLPHMMAISIRTILEQHELDFFLVKHKNKKWWFWNLLTEISVVLRKDGIPEQGI